MFSAANKHKRKVQFAVAEQAQMESARRNSGSGETMPGAMSHMGKELEDIKRELKDVKAGVIGAVFPDLCAP